MRKILVIDGCFGELGTYARRILDAFLSTLPERYPEGYRVERVDLNTLQLAPLDEAALKKRETLIAAKKFRDPMFAYARQLAEADLVVIATPERYGNLPAKLAVYIEHAVCPGVVFVKSDYGKYQSFCKARALVCLTARGLDNPNQYSWTHRYFESLAFFLELTFRMVSARELHKASPEGAEYYVKEACKDAARLEIR